MPDDSFPKAANKTIGLRIWDSGGVPPAGAGTTLLWRGFSSENTSGEVSIPELVEANAESIRGRYLSWLHELGTAPASGGRLVDQLELRPGFSYWWMTLLVEKCNYAKSPQITDAIRLIAFVDWAAGQAVGNVELFSDNPALAQCVKSWCAGYGVTFKWQRTPTEMPKTTRLARIYQSLPQSLQAVAWLILYLIRRSPLVGVGLEEWKQTDGRTTFVSYLFNLLPDETKAAQFASRYWAHLPDEMRRDGRKTNWLHLYVKDPVLPSARQAAVAIRSFNKAGCGEQNHTTLDAFLSPQLVIGALQDWYRMKAQIRGWSRDCFLFEGSVDLWPLFQEDWERSIYGKEAVNNLLYHRLLESAFKALPEQHVGAYLKENQGWEAALIHAWNSAGHGRLIGTPHTTVRFWDLRYFFDTRSYSHTGANDMPMPDCVAVNGRAAWEAYLAAGYPSSDLVEVEALRYLYLAEIEGASAPPPRAKNSPFRVLVFGDYLRSATQQQMQLLAGAAQALSPDFVISIKPHPNCPVRLGEYLGLEARVTMDPVSKLLGECDVAYTSNATSAAIDAYCAGVPVVCFLDCNGLNLSPIREREGVTFVSTVDELRRALTLVASGHYSAHGRQSLFTLDVELPRWKALLQECR